MKKRRKPGPAATGHTPPRSVGRHDNERWERWQAAAAAAGMTWTEWAGKALDSAAEAQTKSKKRRANK